MRRCKTAAARAIVYKKTKLRADLRILAGAYAPNGLFNNLAADNIGQCCRKQETNDPPYAAYAEVDTDEHRQEQVQWQPETSFPNKGQYRIKKRITPGLIDMFDEPLIGRIN